MEDILKLQVKISGQGDPLLLVPGGLTGWISWEPFVKLFSDWQRKIIRVQLINVEYGIENKPLPANYSVETESHALASTFDTIGFIPPMDIIAWSYGALVSLDYALDHPERIRTLTLIEPPAIWVLRGNGELDSETKQITGFFETLNGYITDDMLATFLQKVGLAEDGQTPRTLPQWQAWLPFRQSLANSPAVVTHRDELNRLQDFRAPVLLVKGTGSALFLHKIIDVLGLKFPDSKVIELPGGHAPHIVSRDSFLNEFEKFQREHQTMNI